eukprot:g6719.t1
MLLKLGFSPFQRGDADSKRPIHVVCDYMALGESIAGLFAEFVDKPAAGVFPPGSRVTLWAGNPVGMLSIHDISPPAAVAGQDPSKRAVDVAAAADLEKVHFAAVAGPYLPGKSAGTVMRRFFGLPQGEFPDWFLYPAKRIHDSVSPWFPTTAAAIDGPDYEKVVVTARPSSRAQSRHSQGFRRPSFTASGQPVSVFGSGLGTGYERKVTWLNAVGGDERAQTFSKIPTTDEKGSQIMQELEAEGQKGKTVVYVAFGTFAWVPLKSSDGKREPYAEFLEDLLSLGEDFVVVVRVAFREPETPPTDPLPAGHRKPQAMLDVLTENRVLHTEKMSQAKIILYEERFPQPALFASQQLQQSGRLLFVTHCGVSSISEALRARIPMVTVPAKAEQFWNAQMLHSHGLAVDASAAGFKFNIFNEVKRGDGETLLIFTFLQDIKVRK